MRRRLLLAACAALALPRAPSFTPSFTPAFAREGGALPAVVRLRSLMVPALNQGQVEKYAAYEVTLELADAGSLAAAQALIPRLHEAAMAAFYDGIAQGWVQRGAVTNYQAMHRRLDEVCEKLLGAGVVSRVLIAPSARPASGPP